MILDSLNVPPENCGREMGAIVAGDPTKAVRKGDSTCQYLDYGHPVGDDEPGLMQP